jgi:threonine/homoserine/homoserine lactone efflux protein
MPPIDRLVAFALTAAVVIVVPGPSVLFIVGRALSAGRRTALLSVAGGTVVFLAAILPQFVARSHGVAVLATGRRT